jgi:hypothetical protein
MFTLKLETANADFEIEPLTVIADILRRVAWRLEQGDRSASIKDHNCNTIGEFKFTE